MCTVNVNPAPQRLAYDLALAIGPLKDGQAVSTLDLATEVVMCAHATGQWEVEVEVLGYLEGCPLVKVSSLHNPVLVTNGNTVWEPEDSDAAARWADVVKAAHTYPAL